MATKKKCGGRGIVKSGARAGLCKKATKKKSSTKKKAACKPMTTPSGSCRCGKAKSGPRKGKCRKAKPAKKR